ncbi:DUF4352 domain-containing protein [Planomicrobium sp. CPCC 101110]|uniref:DUF4352 domain-containing protein n=1 Tax=Planomicrobium sp. CPCC 101110 TaxID=2599619 RepID=UPI0011B7C4DF|nr:DUF4352 domain-containing protein [Planomicrobium sp. CPCC 101110]TWT27113.1 DUF4352 domain-containing protein [Planomicrobium sp. CPCC 101110]
MKKAIYFYLAAILLLAGCSGQAEPAASAAENQAEQTAADTAEVAETTETAAAPAYYDGYVKNPQVVDDRLLQEVGQSMRDSKGEINLTNANTEAQTASVGEISLTIREAKIFHFQPDYSLIDFYHSYTHDAEFDMVKFFVEIENTSDAPLHFAPVALVETSAEETKTWEDDIYLEELGGEIAPGETKSGNVGFIIEKSDIDSLTVTTSDVFDKEENKLEDAKKIDIKF